jgi:hypothetical protein
LQIYEVDSWDHAQFGWWSIFFSWSWHSW